MTKEEKTKEKEEKEREENQEKEEVKKEMEVAVVCRNRQAGEEVALSQEMPSARTKAPDVSQAFVAAQTLLGRTVPAHANTFCKSAVIWLRCPTQVGDEILSIEIWFLLYFFVPENQIQKQKRINIYIYVENCDCGTEKSRTWWYFTKILIN